MGLVAELEWRERARDVLLRPDWAAGLTTVPVHAGGVLLAAQRFGVPADLVISTGPVISTGLGIGAVAGGCLVTPAGGCVVRSPAPGGAQCRTGPGPRGARRCRRDSRPAGRGDAHRGAGSAVGVAGRPGAERPGGAGSGPLLVAGSACPGGLHRRDDRDAAVPRGDGPTTRGAARVAASRPELQCKGTMLALRAHLPTLAAASDRILTTALTGSERLERRELERHLRDAGYTAHSAEAIIATSPVLRRVAPGQYALRCRAPRPEEKARAAAPCTWALPRHRKCDPICVRVCGRMRVWTRC